MLFTLGMPLSNVGGRTTFANEETTLEFATNENIQKIIERIFTF